MDESLHDRYARRLGKLAVEVGANVAAGQDELVLAVDVQQAPIARAIAESAYESGARYVTVLYWDQHAKRARLRHAPADSLDFVPDWYERLIADCIERGSAIIVVWGDPEPALLTDVEPVRAGVDHMPLTPSLFGAVGGGEVNWTCVPGPCEGIAQQLLGTPDLDQLWSLIAPIIRLGQDDPVQAWRDPVEQLERRAEQLAERTFDALHFSGPDTDLTVDLLPRARWMSGGITTTWGRSTVANMPTEEVFTTPDARRTEGVVRATRPVQLLGGGMVEGLRLRFASGRAVEVDADTGADAFRASLASDDGGPPGRGGAGRWLISGRSQRPRLRRRFDRRERDLSYRAGKRLPVHRPRSSRGRRSTGSDRLQRLGDPPGHNARRARGRGRRRRGRRRGFRSFETMYGSFREQRSRGLISAGCSTVRKARRLTNETASSGTAVRRSAGGRTLLSPDRRSIVLAWSSTMSKRASATST